MTPISAKLDNSSSDLSLNLGLIKEVSRIPVLFCTYLDLTPDAFSMNSALDFSKGWVFPFLISSEFISLNSSTYLLNDCTNSSLEIFSLGVYRPVPEI